MQKLIDILKHTQLQDCCKNHCRDWRETQGGLPASNHSPNCLNYKTESFFRVTVKGDKNPACILETQEQVKDFCETPEEYDVTEVEMTRDQYEHLDEFEGF